MIDASPDVIVASPALRACQTANIMADALNRVGRRVAIKLDERLRELDFGRSEGLSPADIESLGLQAEFLEWRSEVRPNVPATVESFKSAAERARSVTADILAASDGTTLIVIVSHGHFLRILLAAACLVRRTRSIDGCGSTTPGWLT